MTAKTMERNPRYTATFKRAAGLAVALLTVVVGCDHKEQQMPQLPPRPPAMVTAAPAVTRDTPVYLDEIGRIVAVDAVTIMPQVGGKITAVHFTDGSDVKKGELLFEIDSRPYDAALASAKAAHAQNEAILSLAKTELNRFENAVASAAVSQLEFDQKKNAVQVALARVEASKAAIDTAALNVEYTKIYSPIDGRAGARLVDPGNIVKENNTALLVIQKLDPTYAEFTVTENDLGTVRKYMAATGQKMGQPSSASPLKVEVDVPGDSARVLQALSEMPSTSQPSTRRSTPREGVLTFLNNAVQSETGTVKLRATVPNADYYFWPGQYVNVRMILTVKHNAVLIPAEAQQIGQMGPFVYVVSPQNTAVLRPIKPGQRHGNMVVVDQGVQPGEKVIVSGHMTIMPDGPVMEITGGPPGTQPGTPTSTTAPAK